MLAQTRHVRSPSPARRLCASLPLLVGRFAGLLVTIAAAGCSTPPANDVVRIEPGRYDEAFDAAVEVARVHGLPASLRDRRAGLIETTATQAPSLLEPWARDPASFDQRVAHTISLRRRRVRFEFTPPAPPAAATTGETLLGPDLLGVMTHSVDRTTHEGDLELRAWVYLEQAHTPGIRRSTWSLSRTSQTTIIEDDEPVTSRFWTPVRRDRAYERALLAEVARALAATSPEADAS